MQETETAAAPSPRRRHWADTPILCVLIAALLYGGFVVGRMRTFGYDESRFITVGDRWVYSRAALPPGVNTYSEGGYDGQFCYRLALDPFTRTSAGFGIYIDNPVYRQQRIVYPVLAHLASLGRPEWTAKAMILVNGLALCGIAALGGVYARLAGRHALCGLLPALYPGFLLSLSRDLTEIVQAFFLLAAFLLLRLRRPWMAALAMTLTILTRETALFVVVVAGAFWVLDVVRTRTGRGPVANVPAPFVLLPLAAYVAWQAVLFALWQSAAFQQNHKAFAPMFQDFLAFFGSLLGKDGIHRVWLVECCYLIGFTALVLAALRGSRAGVHVKAVWAFYLLLASTLSMEIWMEDWGFMRVLTELYVAGSLILLEARWRYWAWIALAGGAGVWAFLARDLLLTLR